jgi:hypothetical protein
VRWVRTVCLVAMVATTWAGARAESSADRRRQDMDAQLGLLRARLRRPAPGLPRIRAELEQVRLNKGVNPTGMLFDIYDGSTAVINNLHLDDQPDAVDCLAAFSRDLRARGIDLVVVPVPSNAMVYARLLFPGVTASHDIWPGYTKTLIQLLENDVEVVDLVEVVLESLCRPHLDAGQFVEVDAQSPTRHAHERRGYPRFEVVRLAQVLLPGEA